MVIEAAGQSGGASGSRRLADVYADRHERLDRFIVMYALPGQAFARFGVALLSPLGYGLLFGAMFVAIFLPAFGLGLIRGQQSDDFPIGAVVISAALAGLNVLALIVAQAAAYRISAIHRALSDEDQIRTLIVWDRRWYSPAASALVGGSFALGVLGILYLITRSISGAALPPTTIWFCFVVALFLGQFTFSITMIFFEFRSFTNSRFDLYTLRPIETQALQTTAAGLRQLGVVSIVVFPLFNLVLLSILPGGSNLNVLITAGFLLLAYVATAVGILFPLNYLGTIVKRDKERQLRPLERELNAMVPRVTQMSEADYVEFSRLQTLRNAIADSKDSFLSLGSVARIVGAAALSTLTVIATAAIQFYLERVV